MSERIFIKSSYSNIDPVSGNCVEMSAPDGLDFKKSSYSDDVGGACVEVGALPIQVLMRDSKVEGGPLMGVSPEAFTHFVGGLATESFTQIDN